MSGLFLVPSSLNAQFGQGAVSKKIVVSEASDGLHATVGDEGLRIVVCGDAVVHVVAGPGEPKSSSPSQPWMLPAEISCPGAKSTFTRDADHATVTTAQVQVGISLKDGTLQFRDAKGHMLLQESSILPRTYESAEVNGEKTYHVTERFAPERTEAFYGLGQHQNGMFNYRGATVMLAQNNTDVAIPLFVSSNGYAVMWNTASESLFDNRFPSELKLTALAGDAVDYYVIYGPEMDTILHQYRSMTGHTPMFPRWSYGYFQSKDRYLSQKELLGVAAQYRSEHIPIDGIVQDWFWWRDGGEGDPVFNDHFTDVPEMLKTLHSEHVHAMLSAWGLFDNRSQNFKEMTAKHWDIHPAQVYDATNPAAREFYWKNFAGKLFDQGWDAFWLDSAEPEEVQPHYGDAILRDKQTFIGNGARYTNVFPLLHTDGVSEHWRETTQKKRVFLLTRSAFLGQQRNGATTWSGDIYSTWLDLQKQVPAGLNFALSGNPYWTTDIGGYFQPFDRAPNDPAYQELYARWFEFGAFCPVFRSHGHRDHNEIWTYDRVEPILLKYDRLRYRLMPYIYSLAWKVADEDYTLQRPLVMDFRSDAKTWNISDEFLFGPSLLVSPVVKEGATHREVYLPATTRWYDFWSGEQVEGGHEIEVEAPLDKLPLYIRAGAIVPMGPQVEYADEKPDGPVELRIYRGADGSFDLYDDAGDGYGYEHGERSVVPISWNEATRTLTIGERKGRYPGMTDERIFNIVWVGAKHGVSGEVTEADKTVHYRGAAVTVTAP